MTTTHETGPDATTHEQTETTPLLGPTYRWATVGMVALIFLAAFEELAVTTIMPTVTADLDGRGLYAVAFSATLATSIVGMVVGGIWGDRNGPSRPLLASVAFFVAGLLLSGLAQSMAVFVAGRALQGLGAGALIVSLYVLVARVYAPVDRPRIFGAFAAAWVVPSLVGPTIAGAVAQAWSWHWVFLGVVVLALGALLCVVPSLRATPVDRGRAATGSRTRVALAVVVAVGVAALNAAGHRSYGATTAAAVAVAVAVVVVASRRLLPAGSLLLRRGLPAVVAVRGLAMGTFIASDVYLPYLLQTQYDVPPWLSGVTLTLGAFGWAGASQVQGRLGARLSDEKAMRVGAVLLVAGVGAVLAVAALHLPAVLLALAWVSTGAGMGLITSRASAYVLGVSAPGEQGSNSSAMTIADAVGSSTSIALAGIAFAAVGSATGASAGSGPFLAAIAFSAVLAIATLVASRRIGVP